MLFFYLAVASVATVLAVNHQSSSPGSDLSSEEVTWPSQVYVTENFTVPRAAVSKLGPTAPGYLFYDISGVGSNTTSPLITTEMGQLIWRPQQNISSSNFHVQTYKGQSVLTFLDGNSDSPNVGKFIMLDHSYQELYTVCGGFLNITTESNETCKLNVHETRISHRNTLLALGHNIRPADLTSLGGPKNGWIVDNLVFEFDIPTSKLLFSWSFYDHRNELPLSLSHNKISHPNLGDNGTSKSRPYDFAHLNTVDLVGDDYLISARYFWAAIMLKPNGHVKWFLEVSPCGDD